MAVKGKQSLKYTIKKKDGSSKYVIKTGITQKVYSTESAVFASQRVYRLIETK